MMHGGTVVDKSKHRMHITDDWKRDPWEIVVDGNTARICPTDSNVKFIYYRGHWFRLVIDELVNFDPKSGRNFHEEFENAVREELKRYIKEQGIVFDDEEEQHD